MNLRTKVKDRVLSVSRDTSVPQEVYKMAFYGLVATAAIIGFFAFAALGVGLVKVAMVAIGL